MLQKLLKQDIICINEIILSELIPVLKIRNQIEIIDSMRSLPCISYSIFWEGIKALQIVNLKNGINKVGLPDIMISQHCMDANLELWSLDKHFQLMSKYLSLKVFYP